MTRGGLGLGLLVAALVLGAGVAFPAGAQADSSQGSGSQCVIRGMAQMPFNLEIYDKGSGGNPIARFTGGKTAIAASDFPANPSQSRVSIQTGTGTGSFRIAGYVDASKLPIYTGSDVTVVSGHLWIGANREITVIGAKPGSLRVKKQLSSPLRGSYQAVAPCSSFTLEAKVPSGWTVPGEARGYVVKQDEIEIYDSAGGSSVGALKRSADGNGILLWGSDRRGNWVHVEYHGEVVVKAWAKVSELKVLPKGETMDQLRGSVTKTNPPRIKLAENPRVVKTTREIPIRTKASDSAPVIGRIEADTETYVLDVMAGWASVMPKSLNVAPHGDNQFWVQSSELGL